MAACYRSKYDEEQVTRLTAQNCGNMAKYCTLQGRLQIHKHPSHMPTLRRGVCPTRRPRCLGVPGTMICDPPLEVLAAKACSDSFLADLIFVHVVSN